MLLYGYKHYTDSISEHWSFSTVHMGSHTHTVETEQFKLMDKSNCAHKIITDGACRQNGRWFFGCEWCGKKFEPAGWKEVIENV